MQRQNVAKLCQGSQTGEAWIWYEFKVRTSTLAVIQTKGGLTMLPLDANPHVVDGVTLPAEQLFIKWALSGSNPPPPPKPPRVEMANPRLKWNQEVEISSFKPEIFLDSVLRVSANSPALFENLPFMVSMLWFQSLRKAISMNSHSIFVALVSSV